MKFSLGLWLTVLICFSCSIAVAQTRAIDFDLSSEGHATRAFSGSTRSRLAIVAGVSSARALEREVFALINTERRKNGLVELEWSDNLAAVARLHSQNMAQEKFFSHRGSDGSMVDDRADRLGLGTWRAIGENIAYMRGYDNPAELAVQKWLESTAHRKNLLGPTWKESAVGVSITADGTYYMTEVFLLRN